MHTIGWVTSYGHRDVEHPFHRSNKIAVGRRWNHPIDFPPGLDFVFLTRHTVSWEMLSMYSSLTTRTASIRNNH